MTKPVALVRRGGVTMLSLALTGAFLLTFANTASADVVPNVNLGAAGNYSVLGGLGVTNTGNTTMHQNLGTSPGPTTAVTGFPPGEVLAPGVLDNPGAAAAQLALTSAYDDTHTRAALTGTTGTELGGQTLVGGVYAATTSPKAPLEINGTLTLNAQGNPNTVWIFQSDSTLITGAASNVNLIGGAQECNIFWRVGSSASLDTGAVFRGNILAQTSISLNAGVVVHGRALAQTGGVTLIDDTFDNPTCATSAPAPTTTIAPITGTPTTVPAGTPGLPGAPGVGATTTTLGLTVGIVGPPRTGVAPMPKHDFPWPAVLLAGAGGAAMLGVIVRRRQLARTPR